ncbi:MAG: non-homologous end-joining DNA ligase [Flavobacteriaceae bacterium]|nr:non-homologous end-joining DNA ligase [Flavobacteriaceae bacterium]
MKIAGVEISNADKVIFPTLGITKEEMATYYEKVADKMLPYMKDRPLILQRFPDGIDEDGFYQKSASEYFPDFIKRIKVKTEKGHNTQFYVNSIKPLIYLVNQGTVTFHIWLSKRDRLKRPDKVVFDLDPSGNSFNEVKEAALLIRGYLHKKDIEPFLMTSGKSGLHVWYEKRRTKEFDKVKEEVKIYSVELEKKHSDVFTTAIRKDQRNGKIFIDYLRNEYAQTSVCPYSLRATPEAGIAHPIKWEELSSIKSADQFTIKDYLKS